MSSLQEISFIMVWVMILVVIYVVSMLLRDLEASQVKKTSRKLIGQEYGLEIGSKFPVSEMKMLSGEIIPIQQKRFDGTVVLFTSMGCKVCKGLYSMANELMESYPQVQFILIILDDKEEIENKVSELSLNIPTTSIVQDELLKFGKIPFPFGYFVSGKGNIIAKSVTTNKQLIQLLIKSAYERGQLNLTKM